MSSSPGRRSPGRSGGSGRSSGPGRSSGLGGRGVTLSRRWASRGRSSSSALNGGEWRDGTREGGSDVAKLDVGVDDLSTAAGRFDLGWDTRGSGASTTSDTGLGCVGVGRVIAIEPKHADGGIVPQTHDEDGGPRERLAQRGETTLGLELGVVTEDGLLLVAEVSRDGVDDVDAGDVDSRVLDDYAVLKVQALDLNERAGRSSAVGDELSDDGELLAGIDSASGAVETSVAHAVGVEVATVGVADGGVSVWLLAVAS